jgi:hypothetical protein
VAGMFITLDGVVEAPQKWNSTTFTTGVVALRYARAA